MQYDHKPVIGISCGDINGIGTEIILGALADHKMLELCTPVIFGSNKLINFYRKATKIATPANFHITTSLNDINPKQINIFNAWEEDINIQPGNLTEDGGKYAVIALETAVQALKEGSIQALVTAPIHKKNVQSEQFHFSGHTPYLQQSFEAKDVVMMLCAGNFRVALVTEHLPIESVAQHITKEAIASKLAILHESLRRDFGIDRPKIAVLGLNPHAGDEGLIGIEEQQIIAPAIQAARKKNFLVKGPFSADAFFARGQYLHFDAVLAMYHDQGLIPFKSLASEDGTNFTAGLPVVRTSPDHGVAFDISGQGKADHHSLLRSIFFAIDVINARYTYDDNRSNPMTKINTDVFARLEDEVIKD